MPVFSATTASAYSVLILSPDGPTHDVTARFNRPVRRDEAERVVLAHLLATEGTGYGTVERIQALAEDFPKEENDVVLQAPEPEVLPASTYPLPTDREAAAAEVEAAEKAEADFWAASAAS